MIDLLTLNPCDKCNGTGKRGDIPCAWCNGRGKTSNKLFDEELKLSDENYVFDNLRLGQKIYLILQNECNPKLELSRDSEQIAIAQLLYKIPNLTMRGLLKRDSDLNLISILFTHLFKLYKSINPELVNIEFEKISYVGLFYLIHELVLNNNIDATKLEIVKENRSAYDELMVLFRTGRHRYTVEQNTL